MSVLDKEAESEYNESQKLLTAIGSMVYIGWINLNLKPKIKL